MQELHAANLPTCFDTHYLSQCKFLPEADSSHFDKVSQIGISENQEIFVDNHNDYDNAVFRQPQ